MVNEAAALALSSLSPASLKAYNRNIVHFISFIKSLPVDIPTFPATVGHIVLYVYHLHCLKLAHRTILTRLSALSYWHKAYSRPDPADHFLVKRALTGVKKADTGKKLRCPLSLSTLNFILGNLHQLRWPMYTQALFRAMLATSFHGFLRPGEMVDSHNALKFKDIQLKSSSFKLRFRKFKHHRGEPVKVKVKG
ncbi:MAG: hypothetical protein GY774_19160, partial [Planctomycetes bacterium]|nr:hypothetical protein [Planctomycetota bacterium]